MLLNALQSYITRVQLNALRRHRGRPRSRLTNWRQTPQSSIESLEDRLLLATQLIASTAIEISAQPGETINVPVNYQTLDAVADPAVLRANLLDFNLHFDSDALEFIGLSSGSFTEGRVSTPDTVMSESVADGDADTETILRASYSDFDALQNPGWPNAHVADPLLLFTVQFSIRDGFVGTSSINFTSNNSAIVVGQPLEFEFLGRGTTIIINDNNATLTVGLEHGRLEVRESVGNDVNHTLTLDSNATSIIITDPNNLIATAIPGATGNGTHEVTVPLADISSILVTTMDGDDSIVVASSIDLPTTLDGGNGDDTLRGGMANDLLLGSAGNDKLVGNAGEDVLVGGDGNDTLFGGVGDDTLTGGLGNDRIDGQRGIDTLLEQRDVAELILTANQLTSGSELDQVLQIEKAELIGGDSDNTFRANDAASSIQVTLRGGGGDDKLIGSRRSDVLDGGIGNDTLFGSTGNDLLIGGLGDDMLNGQGGIDRLISSGNVDFTLSDGLLIGLGTDITVDIEKFVLTGGDSANVFNLVGFSGKATVNGASGDDTILGGAGKELMLGGPGNDELNGGGGVDRLFGEDGNDLLIGGTGNDQLTGGLGDDTIDGGQGTDRIKEEADVDFSIFDTHIIGIGTDQISNIEKLNIKGGPGDNFLDASGYSSVAILQGREGNDTLIGGSGIDTLNGNGGNDSLVGNAGNDRLNGGADNDLLNGGDGNDTLAGKGGIDRVIEFGDTNFSLTDKRLFGRGTDRYTDVEELQLTGGPSNNTIDASAFTGNATLNGGGGNDSLVGGVSSDLLDGGTGNDTILGQDGNDTLVGGPGNDNAHGGAGNDSISGGEGIDTASGGSGFDTIDADVESIVAAFTRSSLFSTLSPI